MSMSVSAAQTNAANYAFNLDTHSAAAAEHPPKDAAVLSEIPKADASPHDATSGCLYRPPFKAPDQTPVFDRQPTLNDPVGTGWPGLGSPFPGFKQPATPFEPPRTINDPCPLLDGPLFKPDSPLGDAPQKEEWGNGTRRQPTLNDPVGTGWPGLGSPLPGVKQPETPFDPPRTINDPFPLLDGPLFKPDSPLGEAFPNTPPWLMNLAQNTKA